MTDAWGDPSAIAQACYRPPSPTSSPPNPFSSPPSSSSPSSSPNAGNQPQVVEYEQSFGFVEVGEDELEGGGYKLKRNASTVVLTSDGLAQHQRQIESLERGMDDLRVEFERLKQQVLEFEEENHQWSLRYSRRMAVLANASLGSWIFWSRFILFVKRHKADFIQGWLRSSSSSSPSTVATRAAAPLLLRTRQSLVRQAIIGGGRVGKRASFNKLFTTGYVFAIRHSWVFLLSSYLINKKGFRRWLGLIASTCYSVYLAFFTDTVPWTSYFTIFANLLYITACLVGMNDSENEVPSLFNLHKGGREPTLSPTSSSASASSTSNGAMTTNGSGSGGQAMARNNSFVSRHTRNPSRGGRKISTPTPLSAFALTSPTPSFSSTSPPTFGSPFPSSSSSSSTSSSPPMPQSAVVDAPRSPSPVSSSASPFPLSRMRKNRSNVHFVLDEEAEEANGVASASST